MLDRKRTVLSRRRALKSGGIVALAAVALAVAPGAAVVAAGAPPPPVSVASGGSSSIWTLDDVDPSLLPAVAETSRRALRALRDAFDVADDVTTGLDELTRRRVVDGIAMYAMRLEQRATVERYGEEFGEQIWIDALRATIYIAERVWEPVA